MHDSVSAILRTHMHGNSTDLVQNVLVKCVIVVHVNLLDIKFNRDRSITSHSFCQPLNAELDIQLEVLGARGPRLSLNTVYEWNVHTGFIQN